MKSWNAWGTSRAAAVHRDDYIEIEDAFDTMAVRASIALCNLLKFRKIRH